MPPRQSPVANFTRAAVTAILLSAMPRTAHADGTPLRMDLAEPNAIKLDGVPKEWSQALVPLSYTTKGEAGRPDLEARAIAAYDQTNIYVGVDVVDDKLRPGGDFVSFIIGFPGGTTYEMKLFPGEPGRAPGVAKGPDNRTIPGAKVVEAPDKGGWSLEASVPWSAIPQAKTLRVGMRGAIFVHDADDSNTVESIVGTGPSSGYASLPSLVTESEQALGDGLLREKHITAMPRFNLMADVVGDAMKERVLVYDRYLVVLGPTYHGGTDYYWSDIGVDVNSGMLPSCEVRDVTGDGQAEIILRKRIGTVGKWREVLQVFSFGSGDVPNSIFQHEVGISTEAGSIANDVKFVAEGGRTAIMIQAGTAKGYTAATYREPTESDYDPLLLPWGGIKSQTYRYSGGSFSKIAEEKQAGVQTAAASPAPASQPTRSNGAASAPAAPPSGGDLSQRVYDQYKRDRGVSGQARFEIAADVAGDRQAERVLIHDRDLVVFGKGFKGGAGYSYLSLSMFASASDITDLSSRDLTGDGKAEVIVRGMMHANAPKEAGAGVVDREIVVVYQIGADAIRRVFAAEVGRAIGKRRIIGAMRFVSGGASTDIELAPDRAVEWTEKTYPFNADSGQVGGFEPLILPWGNSRALRYRWTGNSFSR